jgi:DNA repair exonuclease SbcCD ATPase subunit
MASAEKISQLRDRFVSELKNLEHEVSAELKQIQSEIVRLNSGTSKRQARKTGTKSNTVSILTGKICPKCGKKGHDLRWHRWNDKKAAGTTAARRAS